MNKVTVITDWLRRLAKKSKFPIGYMAQVKQQNNYTDYGMSLVVRYCFIKNIDIKQCIPFYGWYASSDRVIQSHGKKKPNLFMWVQKQYNG